ncbi:MAG: glycerol-3-phosphate 1-O-acyltransferase PlsY [Oscillospiraceae bacterium]|jgi:glycerol-3-phosphate acyltransferase PlsY|nr:glycerol-3-phosphate 1-O-acyltransferase PlsY [Oscillospiraceae bacterium]MBQ8930433.1 glycerol-3-phosphate 1-O-acyltransferase PlsY [Oscillospiraceae bacterium]
MLWLVLVCSAVISYLSGAVNGAIIASKYYYHKDIRQLGSGNAGLTNYQRVFGWKSAAVVIIIDVLKTVLPVIATRLIAGHFFGLADTGAVWSGLFVMLGHAFPVYYEFQGGKTVLAGGTVLFFVDWRVALIAWGCFLLCVLLTRYVSLGSIAAGIAYPVAVAALGVGDTYTLILAALSGLLLVCRHHKNIWKLLHGQESKLQFHKEKKE